MRLPRSTHRVRALVALATLAPIACVAPRTQLGSVSPARIAEEQDTQTRLAIQTGLDYQRRLDRVARPLLGSATPFCGDAVAASPGFRLGTVADFPVVQRAVARTMGFSDTLSITSVAPGSAAAHAGVAIGDQLLAVNGVAIPTGRQSLATAASIVADAATSADSLRLSLRRDGVEQQTRLPITRACSYEVLAERSNDLQAYADGRHVVVTTGMLRFLNDTDLAVVVGHEIAHNAMGHIKAKTTNATVGAIFGALADIALATQGYNSNGDFSRIGASAGATVFSQDFEREADYIGLYIMALSGQSVATSAQLWRQLAAENPGSIRFATTHPTSAERFVRLQEWTTEIDSKLASGAPLSPEVRGRHYDVAVVAAGELASRARTTATTGAVIPASVGVTATAVASPITDVRGAHEAPQGVAASRRPVSNAATPSAAATARSTTARAVTDDGIGGTTLANTGDGRQVATATIGAPLSEDDRRAGRVAFDAGKVSFARHDWSSAESFFRRALRLDGSIAEHHASLGAVLLVLERGAEAEAAYSAALLLDPSNREYALGLQDARRVP